MCDSVIVAHMILFSVRGHWHVLLTVYKEYLLISLSLCCPHIIH